MAEISIILPVYNVANYIEECLRSLMAQSFSDIEMVVVDDCGQDDSMRRAERLAEADSRITIIRGGSNQGPAEARNIGLRQLQSPYVAFVDPDDWVAPDFFEKLYRELVEHDADIAVGNTYYYSETEKSCSEGWVGQWNFKSGKKLAVLPEEKQFNIYACACWGKLFKSSLFRDGRVQFPKGLKIEDVHVTAITSVLAGRIVMVEDAYLYYRNWGDSIMGQGCINRTPFDIFPVYEYTDACLAELGHVPYLGEYRKILDNFKIFNIYGWYHRTHPDMRPEFFERMKALFRTLDVRYNPYISEETMKIYRSVVLGGQELERRVYRLFAFIPLLTLRRFLSCTKVSLFGCIPLYKVKRQKRMVRHYLFGFLPIMAVRVNKHVPDELC